MILTQRLVDTPEQVPHGRDGWFFAENGEHLHLDLVNRLAAMTVVPCQEYVDSLKVCLPDRSRLLLLLIFILSSGSRTTSPRRGPPRAPSTTSGRAATTSRRSTRSTAASTAACPRHKHAARLRSVSLCYIPLICFPAILQPAACSWGSLLDDYFVLIHRCTLCTTSIYIRIIDAKTA